MGKLSVLAVLSLLTLAASIAPRCDAAEWGTLTGKFIFDGEPAKPKKLEITKDQEYCGKFQDEIVEQSVLVGEQAGLSNVFIWLRVPSGKKVSVHPDLEKLVSTKPAELDNLHCMFYPHALGMVAKKQTLVVKNSDQVAQVVKIDLLRNSSVNSTIAIGATTEHKFQSPEKLPSKVTCGIHPWENAYLLVNDTPYFAITNSAGEFTIKDLPVGDWEFQVWHEQPGYLSADPKWKNGRFTLKISEGENSLGTIKVDPNLLKSK